MSVAALHRKGPSFRERFQDKISVIAKDGSLIGSDNQITAFHALSASQTNIPISTLHNPSIRSSIQPSHDLNGPMKPQQNSPRIKHEAKMCVLHPVLFISFSSINVQMLPVICFV
eukprot:TRINITY_DN5173_c0_g1_i2.p1 TRINITY_DN5173_c0_g1~~TRINITY_DN5173_c0_g1_i2.p1  ORF type:complete len:115 (+),score=14.05 TRINITY_DN5173_c0_g1_i2:107-451(+)